MSYPLPIQYNDEYRTVVPVLFKARIIILSTDIQPSWLLNWFTNSIPLNYQRMTDADLND